MTRPLFQRLFTAALLLFSLLVTSIVQAEPSATVNFTVKDLNGIKHKLSNYHGRWVLVNYWATWCPPCLEEVPDLVSLYENRPKKDVMVIGVVFDYKNLKEVTDYIDDMLVSYPVVLSDDAVTNQFEAVSVLPTTFIFNPDGKLVKVKHGIITKQYIEKIMATNGAS